MALDRDCANRPRERPREFLRRADDCRLMPVPLPILLDRRAGPLFLNYDSWRRMESSSPSALPFPLENCRARALSPSGRPLKSSSFSRSASAYAFSIASIASRRSFSPALARRSLSSFRHFAVLAVSNRVLLPKPRPTLVTDFRLRLCLEGALREFLVWVL